MCETSFLQWKEICNLGMTNILGLGYVINTNTIIKSAVCNKYEWTKV